MVIGLLGFGTVGRGVYDILLKNENIKVKYVLDIKIHSDIEAISTCDINDILNDGEVDTVVELIGGLNVAHDFVVKSLKAGKNVITANKLMISRCYSELIGLARENGVALRYTAAVGGGIQWLINLERVKRISAFECAYGILNGTTNYILDAMHSDKTTFEDALKEAQSLGFAEADPSSDVDGLDTLRKIIITANIAFDTVVDADDTDVFGIGNITDKNIEAAEDLGKVCRLLGYCGKNGEKLSVFVEPAFVECDSLEASVHKNFNLISYEADYVGKQSYYGYGAGRYPTAYTVVEDCIDVANGVKHSYSEKLDKSEIDNSCVKHKYYVSFCGSSAWLDGITDKNVSNGIITVPVSVSEMHNFAKENKCFFAAIM